MQTIEFLLEGDYIELLKLLKAVNIAQTGGHAKMIVDDELVVRNGEVETRRRAKIIKGDVLVINEEIEITIV